MKRIEIFDLSPEALKEMITEAMKETLKTKKAEPSQTTLLTKKEVCQQLLIKPSTFELHRNELMRYGMFQVSGPGSCYRMCQEDLNKYINHLKSKRFGNAE